MLEKSLREEGFEVATASDGNEALRTLKSLAADVVVTDIFMPDKDGIETISELRRRYPGLKIIAMSGGPTRPGQVDYLLLISDIGVDCALRKPFRPLDLVEVIRKLDF